MGRIEKAVDPIEENNKEDNKVNNKKNARNKKEKIKAVAFLIVLFAVIVTISMMLSNLILENQPEKIAPDDTRKETIAASESPVINQDIYLIGQFENEFEEYLKDYSAKKIELNEGLRLDKPSFILIDVDSLNKKDKELYQTLVNKKHAVLFIGENLNPDDIVEAVDSEGIVVIPISGSSESFYQAYGGMYFKENKENITLFSVTNEQNKVDPQSIVYLLADIQKTF